MALFDKIFKKPEAVTPQEWSLIVLAISKSLADIRTKFYVKCLDAMIEFAKRAEFAIDPPPYAEDVQGLNIKAHYCPVKIEPLVEVHPEQPVVDQVSV